MDVRVDTFPRGSYSSTAQIHRVQFRPGPPMLGWETAHGKTPRSGEHLTGLCVFGPQAGRNADPVDGSAATQERGRHDRVAGAPKTADRESVEADLHGQPG